METVAVAKGTDLEQMTDRAVGFLGGIEQFVKAEEKVFIKPNYLSSAYDPYKGVVVKPEIVKKVARLCLDVGAKVTVGEYNQLGPVDFDILGIRELESEGVALLDLKLHDCCCRIPGTTALGDLYVNKHILDADKFISISVFKTHSGCCNTLCAKNLIGTTPVHLYGLGVKGVRFILHRAGIDNIIVDLAAGLKPCLNIIDCSVGIEGEGPGLHPPHSETRDVKDYLGFWVVLAGANTFETDIIGSAMMYQDPYLIRYYRMALDRGLIDSLNPLSVPLIGDEMNIRKLLMPAWKHPACYPQLPAKQIICEESIPRM